MLRLGDAIRAGAMLAPQGYGEASARTDANETCAWGAAFQAAGLKGQNVVGDVGESLRGRSGAKDTYAVVVPDSWLDIALQTSPCPMCTKTGKVMEIVTHLNDDHKLSRTEIADWVDTKETSPN